MAKREEYQFLLLVLNTFTQLESEIYYVFDLYGYFLDTSTDIYFDLYKKLVEISLVIEDAEIMEFIHSYVSI